MTDLQWYYHYLEIKRHRDEENQREYSLIESALDILMKQISNASEFSAMISNPRVYLEFLKDKDTQGAREEIKDENFTEIFEELKKTTFKPIIVNKSELIKSEDAGLPKMKIRALGIQKKK